MNEEAIKFTNTQIIKHLFHTQFSPRNIFFSITSHHHSTKTQ